MNCRSGNPLIVNCTRYGCLALAVLTCGVTGSYRGVARGDDAIDVHSVTGLNAAETDVEADVALLTSNRQHAAAYSETFRAAWQAHRRGNSPEAISLFQSVLDGESPTDGERVQAMYGLATVLTFGLTPDTKQAKELLTRIVDEHGGNPAAPWALLELGRLHAGSTPETREEERDFYQRVIDAYPNSVAIHEATVRLAGSYYNELDPEHVGRATEILELHLDAYPGNPLASVMHFRLMYWYQEVDRDYDRGLKHSIALGELKMSDPARWGQHMWNTAQVYRIRKNNPTEALHWYRRIVEEAPSDRMVGDARQMIQLLESQDIQVDHKGKVE